MGVCPVVHSDNHSGLTAGCDPDARLAYYACDGHDEPVGGQRPTDGFAYFAYVADGEPTLRPAAPAANAEPDHRRGVPFRASTLPYWTWDGANTMLEEGQS